MEPSEFLEHAKKIVEIKGDEAAMRSACSRAYYAAFHSCKYLKNYIDARPYNTETGEHQRLINHLINCVSLISQMNSKENVRIIKKLGHKLGDLRNSRHDADYDLESVFLETEANLAIASAQTIISNIKNLSSIC